ncbi:MAG: GFA family protein [Myxococcales bacterium]
MADAKTYEGSCHCGKIAYQATADLSGAMECNCSICSRKGAIMTFVPAEKFRLISGEGAATDYQFGKKAIHHFFCPTCGIHAYARGTGRDGQPMYMLNVRCLAGVEPWSLQPQHFDGRSR